MAPAVLLTAMLVGTGTAVTQQPVPQPFPRPGQPAPTPAPPAPAQVPQPTVQATSTRQAPAEAMLGVPVYPGAQFLASYDAGRGQRFYLYGANISFLDLVSYYNTVLDSRGNRVFEAPATHVFEVGRFREETMAFPTGVTVKDYTWNGSPGYLNPEPGAEPARFRTVIQIVPVPPSTRR